jgi:general secretion pathway protein D
MITRASAFAACVALSTLCAGVRAEESPGPAVSRSGEPPTISIYDLIERVAKKTGKRFVIDPRVHGLVPLSGLDLNRVDYETLLAVLRVNQFAAFTQDGIVNVLPEANARQFPTPVVSGDDSRMGDDEFVTRVIKVENACAAWLVPILRPLMPQAAHLAAAYPPSNMLIMDDRASNVRRIAELVKRLDVGPKQTCEQPKSGS